MSKVNLRRAARCAAAVLWHGRRLTDALRAGEITVDGNRAAVGRFLKLFPAPTLR